MLPLDYLVYTQSETIDLLIDFLLPFITSFLFFFWLRKHTTHSGENSYKNVCFHSQICIVLKDDDDDLKSKK